MDNSFTITLRVVLLPDPAEGITHQEAVENLAARFGIGPEKAGTLLDGAPRIIKKGLTQKQALEYHQALKACGLECRIEAEENTDEAPATAATDDRYRCPHCGYAAQGPDDPLITAFDGQGQCPACNIIVTKYNQGPQDRAAAEDGAASDSAGSAAAGDDGVSGSPGPNLIFPAEPARSSKVTRLIVLAVLCIAFVAVGYLLFKPDGAPDKTASATRPGGLSHPAANSRTRAAKAIQQEQQDRIQALDLADAQVDSSWFDGDAIRIAPGETWEGSLTLKLPFESAYLTIPPQYGGDKLGERMYRDLKFHVDENPWQKRNVRISVTGQFITGYHFPIWVMAEGSRVTCVIQPRDRSISLEQLGQMPRNQLTDIEWTGKKPRDFNPVFDLTQGKAQGYQAEVFLTIAVPAALADYRLGRHTGSHAETISLKGQRQDDPHLAMTLAKKKGDPTLYLKPETATR